MPVYYVINGFIDNLALYNMFAKEEGSTVSAQMLLYRHHHQVVVVKRLFVYIVM